MKTEPTPSTEHNEARQADTRLLFLLKKSIKFIFCLMLILASILYWNSIERPTTITGYIAGLPDGELFISGTFLYDFGENETAIAHAFRQVGLSRMGIDLNAITEIRGGRFKFILPDDGIYLIHLVFQELFQDGKHFIPHNIGLWFIVEPRNRVRVVGQVNSISEGLSNITISDERFGRSASVLNRDFIAFQNQLFEIHKNESRDEIALHQAMVVDGNIEQMRLGLAQREERNDANLELLTTYIKTNPDNPVSAFIVAHILPQTLIGSSLYRRLPPDTIVSYYNILGENARNSVFHNLLNARIQDFTRTILLREARKNVVVGSKAPDFTLNDVDGNPFALSSLRGNYVVLNFWGTWCRPCIRGIPRLRELYEKYGDVVRFVGIASNERSVDAWRETVRRFEKPWINVLDETSKIVAKYAVSAFPTKYIICPEGKILVQGFLDFNSEVLSRILPDIIER